jgi:RNA polymerase sigma factor (sigma-70 family)
MREADGARPSRLHTDLKNDAEVAVDALRGSGAACETLVKRFERPVYNLIARLVQDPGMAEDLTQDTFVKMFRALGTFDPRLRFSSWLFRIAHNTAIDYLRQRRLAVVAPAADENNEARDTLASIADVAGEGGVQPRARGGARRGNRSPAAGISIGHRAPAPGGPGIRRDCARAGSAAGHGEDLPPSRPARAGASPRRCRIRA